MKRLLADIEAGEVDCAVVHNHWNGYYLNEPIDPAEVIAIDVKRFVGTGVKAHVPRVIGQSETVRQKKSSGGQGGGMQWDETSFFVKLLERRGPVE